MHLQVTVIKCTSFGKLNSIILVWWEYIMSSICTATASVAILLKHLQRHKKELNKLEGSIKNNQK